MENILLSIDRLFVHVPFVNRWNSFAKLFLVVGLLAGVFATVFYYSTKPTLSERLMDPPGHWAIEAMSIDGRDTIPFTNGIGVQWEDERKSIASMSIDDRIITFPGLNTYSGTARWKSDDHIVEVLLADSNARIFEGKYEAEIRGDILTMRSSRVYIRAHQVRFNLPF